MEKDIQRLIDNDPLEGPEATARALLAVLDAGPDFLQDTELGKLLTGLAADVVRLEERVSQLEYGTAHIRKTGI